jgi:hypothetical protein
VLASTVASAAYVAGAGITGTPHDWSAPVTGGGTGGGTALLQWMKAATDTSATAGSQVTAFPYMDPVTGKQAVVRVQIGQCTKCHTPHQAKSTNLLWNHTLQTTGYSWNVPATTAGTTYATFKGDTYKGPTTKCLSCHDGAISSTDGMWFNRAMTAGAKYLAPAGSFNTGHEVATAAGDMSGTHPVAMPYPLGNAGGTYNFTTTGSQATLTDWVADPTTKGIRLFQDDGTGNIIAGTSAGKTGIECTSCHDVHNGSRTKDQLLLTGKLAGGPVDGYICTQCHQK